MYLQIQRNKSKISNIKNIFQPYFRRKTVKKSRKKYLKNEIPLTYLGTLQQVAEFESHAGNHVHSNSWNYEIIMKIVLLTYF